MTGNHKSATITRRRAITVTGGTVAAGGLAVAGYQSAFADTTTAAGASATTSATASPGGSVPAESEESDSADDSTYLRGYQVANANGVVKFETVFPGWYVPRTCHIHVKVHTGGEKEDGTYEGGKVNYTGQLFFDDDIAEEIFTLEPYSRHTGTCTALADDMVYDDGATSGLLTFEAVHKKDPSKGYKGFLTLGIDPDAEGTGAGSGGGGTPPSDGASPPGDSASPSASASASS